MIAIDRQMFGKDWWFMPLAARYASVDAHSVGLTVQVEMSKRATHNDEALCINWRGTSGQFAATKTFPRGVFAKRRSGRYVHPDWLRGMVYPDGDDTYLFVIEHCNYYGKAHLKKRAQPA